MEKEHIDNCSNRKIQIFFIITLVNLIISVFIFIITRGDVLNDLVFNDGDDCFMDFMNHISYVRNNASGVYYIDKNANFPPLAYVMYYFFSRILPDTATTIGRSEWTSSYALMLFISYNLVIVILLQNIISKYLSKCIKYVPYVLLSIVLSNVYYLYVIERGNSVGIVVVLLLYALYYKDDKDPKKRELSLILIAIAAGIKVYPALFGLLYISEKKWKESFRLICYGLATFFVPFVFFGGIGGMIQFFRNQMWIQKQGTSFQSIGMICRFFAKTTGNDYAYISLICTFVVAFILMTSFFVQKTDWKKVALLSIMMIILPGWSGSYTSIYMLIPMVLLFSKSNEGNVEEYFFSIFFGFLFSSLAITNKSLHHLLGVTMSEFYISMVNYFVCLAIVLLTAKEYISNRKNIQQ